jgi:hypothetical protein
MPKPLTPLSALPHLSGKEVSTNVQPVVSVTANPGDLNILRLSGFMSNLSHYTRPLLKSLHQVQVPLLVVSHNHVGNSNRLLTVTVNVKLRVVQLTILCDSPQDTFQFHQDSGRLVGDPEVVSLFTRQLRNPSPT